MHPPQSRTYELIVWFEKGRGTSTSTKDRIWAPPMTRGCGAGLSVCPPDDIVGWPSRRHPATAFEALSLGNSVCSVFSELLALKPLLLASQLPKAFAKRPLRAAAEQETVTKPTVPAKLMERLKWNGTKLH